MKRLAFFLALFVGLNASSIARKPEEDDCQVIVAKDRKGKSTAAWIQSIAFKLKACFYGISKDGFLHELRYGTDKKISDTPVLVDNMHNHLSELPISPKSKNKPKLRWIQFVQKDFGKKSSCLIRLYEKRNGEWLCIDEIIRN